MLAIVSHGDAAEQFRLDCGIIEPALDAERERLEILRLVDLDRTLRGDHPDHHGVCSVSPAPDAPAKGWGRRKGISCNRRINPTQAYLLSVSTAYVPLAWPALAANFVRVGMLFIKRRSVRRFARRASVRARSPASTGRCEHGSSEHKDLRADQMIFEMRFQILALAASLTTSMLAGYLFAVPPI